VAAAGKGRGGVGPGATQAGRSEVTAFGDAGGGSVLWVPVPAGARAEGDRGDEASFSRAAAGLDWATEDSGGVVTGAGLVCLQHGGEQPGIAAGAWSAKGAESLKNSGCGHPAISVNLDLLHLPVRGTEHHGRPAMTRVHGHDPRAREDPLFRVFRVFRGSNPSPRSSTSHGSHAPTRGSTPPPRPCMQWVHSPAFVEPRNTRNTRKPKATSPRQGMPHRAFRVRPFQG
jgi:hypothetical protein